MPRPRKNPNDPKWETIRQPESIKSQELTDVKLVLYAVSLAGVIAQNRPASLNKRLGLQWNMPKLQ